MDMVASLVRRRLAVGKSAARLSGGVGGSGDFGQSDSVESMPARKASVLVPLRARTANRHW